MRCPHFKVDEQALAKSLQTANWRPCVQLPRKQHVCRDLAKLTILLPSTKRDRPAVLDWAFLVARCQVSLLQKVVKDKWNCVPRSGRFPLSWYPCYMASDRSLDIHLGTPFRV